MDLNVVRSDVTRCGSNHMRRGSRCERDKRQTAMLERHTIDDPRDNDRRIADRKRAGMRHGERTALSVEARQRTVVC